MRNKNFFMLARFGKTSLSLFCAVILVVASLVILELTAHAGRSAGANGCGTFSDAVDLTPAHDFIIPTAPDPGAENDRPSDGKELTIGVLIQGGWRTPSGGCSEGNQVFTATADLLSFGYAYTPSNRSVLTHMDGSVLNISHTGYLTIENMILRSEGGTIEKGGGISGTISGSSTKLLIKNSIISNANVTNEGGGLYLNVRNGAKLIIEDSEIVNNSSSSGGGFEIMVYDDSEVVIKGSTFSNNTANTGNGGGGRIVIDSGKVYVQGNNFTNNKADAGNGGGLAIESTDTSTATVILQNNTYSGNSAMSSTDLYTSGTKLFVLDQSIFLPAIFNNESALAASITDITLSGSTYNVQFSTTGFTPASGQTHIHFFFDTVPREQAGVPGSGNWQIHTDSNPFTGYTTSDRPLEASQLCVLVANSDHTVQQGTGNCFKLPGY